jgi:hypothetical protein
MEYGEEIANLSKIADNWGSGGKKEFLDILSNQDGRIKIRFLDTILTYATDTNQTDCFVDLFPHLMEIYNNQIVLFGTFDDLKINLYQNAAINKNDLIIALLLKNDFIPHDHEFRQKVINCDPSLFDVNIIDHATINKVVDISFQLFHQKENRQFLKKFLSIPLVNNCFYLSRGVIKYSSSYGGNFEKVKFLIEIGQSHGKELGQVFIDYTEIDILPQCIDGLIFIINRGGKEIDRLFQAKSAEEIVEIFFRLTVRKVEFKTDKSELLNQVVEFSKELRKQLLDVGIINDVVDIVLHSL